MGIFDSKGDLSIVEEVERATSENVVEEDWSVIMAICDKAGKSMEDAKGYLKVIIKRLNNTDPHIAVKAVTLLDACVKNSGKIFHIEIASRDFENDFIKLMQKGHPVVAKKLRESLKRWAENEFKSDSQLGLIPSLYQKLKLSYDFSSDTPVKKTVTLSKDPNVVESQEEEEQILKAIELSLKDASSSPRTTSSSLYPSVNSSGLSSTASDAAKEPRKVRALYDFEAAEDNELTFSAGEIIMVIDDTDKNWWKGSNQRGEGLFPANFVTADLSVEPGEFLMEKAKKLVQFKEETKVAEKEPEDVEINESKIDQVLHLLHEADPTNPEKDTTEMLTLEKEVGAMGPLIDAELERVDRKHAQLTQLSADLVEALGLYHTLMREPAFPSLNKPVYQYAGPGSLPYPGPGLPPGPLPHQHAHPMMGPPHQHMNHSMPGPPGLPPNVQERLPYQPPMHPYQHMMMAPPQGGGVPAGGGMPQQTMMAHQMLAQQQQHQQQQHPMVDGRRMDMVPNFPPGMPNFVPAPGMSQTAFVPGGPQLQVSLQNGPTQSPAQFVTSSTHIIH